MYNQSEAAIGSSFPMLPATIEKISQRTGFNPEELRSHLENMADKGLVVDIQRKGGYLLRLIPVGGGVV